MATTISRNFSEINQTIKDIKKSTSEANAEMRQLEQTAKLDPHSFEVANQRIQTLNKTIKQSANDIATLKSQQQQYIANGGQVTDEPYKKLDKQIVSTTNSLLNAKNQLKELNKEAASGQFNDLSTKLKTVSGSLDTLKGKVQTISNVAKAALAALAALTVAFVTQGDAIDDLSKKYNIDVETIQIQQNLYEKITGSADNYSTVLKKLTTQLASARKGSADAISAFKELGVSEEDLSSLSLDEIYSKIISALSTYTDETTAAAAASDLLGDSGLYISEIAQTNAEDISDYNDELEENGILTQDETDAASDLADAWTDIKEEFIAVAAQLVTALQPAFEDFIAVLKDDIIPVITSLANWFGSLNTGTQKAVLIAIGIIAILPTLITIIQGLIMVVNLVNVALTFLAANPVVATIIAIIAAVLLLIAVWKQLLKLFGVKVDNPAIATPTIDTSSLTNTVSTAATTTNKQELDVNVDVSVTSDVPAAETFAQQIADTVVDKVNEKLADIKLANA